MSSAKSCRILYIEPLEIRCVLVNPVSVDVIGHTPFFSEARAFEKGLGWFQPQGRSALAVRNRNAQAADRCHHTADNLNPLGLVCGVILDALDATYSPIAACAHAWRTLAKWFRLSLSEAKDALAVRDRDAQAADRRHRTTENFNPLSFVTGAVNPLDGTIVRVSACARTVGGTVAKWLGLSWSVGREVLAVRDRDAQAADQKSSNDTIQGFVHFLLATFVLGKPEESVIRATPKAPSQTSASKKPRSRTVAPSHATIDEIAALIADSHRRHLRLVEFVGPALRIIRIGQIMTQESLAKIMSEMDKSTIRQSYISRVEEAEITVSWDRLELFCAALKTSPNKVLEIAEKLAHVTNGDCSACKKLMTDKTLIERLRETVSKLLNRHKQN